MFCWALRFASTRLTQSHSTRQSGSSTEGARTMSEARRAESNGGAEGIQTPGLRNANAALYQLSYSPNAEKYTRMN